MIRTGSHPVDLAILVVAARVAATPPRQTRAGVWIYGRCRSVGKPGPALPARCSNLASPFVLECLSLSLSSSSLFLLEPLYASGARGFL